MDPPPGEGLPEDAYDSDDTVTPLTARRGDTITAHNDPFAFKAAMDHLQRSMTVNTTRL